MILMPCRYSSLKEALEGLNQTQVPLVSVDSEGFFYPSGFSDDKGLYYFVPKIAKLLGLSLQEAIDIFLISLILIASVISIYCFFAIFKHWIHRLISFVGVFLIAFLAYRSSDVYIAGYFAVGSIVPIFMLFNEKGTRFGKWMILSLLFSGVVASTSHFIRYGSGLGILIFASFWVFLNQQISFKEKVICCLILIGSFFLANWNIDRIYKNRDHFLHHSQERFKKQPHQFPFWHLVFIGLGYLENSYNLEYKDGCGINFVGSRASYLSQEYNQILKREVFSILKKHPLFVLKSIACKAFILIYKIFKYMNYGLIFSLYIRPSIRIYFPFVAAAFFYMIPGLVVVPENQYVLGMLTLCSFFGIYMIGLGLKKYWERSRLIFQ